VRITYLALVAVSWATGAIALIAVQRTVVDVAYSVIAVVNAATMYWAYRNARTAIGRNTTAPDRLDVGL